MFINQFWGFNEELLSSYFDYAYLMRLSPDPGLNGTENSNKLPILPNFPLFADEVYFNF